MKARFQIGGMLVSAEGNSKDIHYNDLERVVKVLASVFDIDYDSFLETICSDLVTELLEEAQEERDAIAEFERVLDADLEDMERQERELGL